MKPLARLFLLFSLSGVILAQASAPFWWGEQSVLASGETANDYAAVNLGQVKTIAVKAIDEMNARLTGGAGTTLDALKTEWLAAAGQGVTRNDYAAVNQGQLKTLAKLFYDRLIEVNYDGPPLTSGDYPWTTVTTDDHSYAAANIGQVKYLFSFEPILAYPDADNDSDGMTNAWEVTHGLNPIVDNATADKDGDGLSDLLEYRLGTNPNGGSSYTNDNPANTIGLKVHRPN